MPGLPPTSPFYTYTLILIINKNISLQVLDSVVIKLEGGSDFDLTVLDLPDPEEEKREEGETGERRQDSAKRKKDLKEVSSFCTVLKIPML
jgi:hypothetical protein